nr:hypothetical protein B0A51_13757 [Rachicladosporium sp. CCFEE 5018]
MSVQDPRSALQSAELKTSLHRIDDSATNDHNDHIQHATVMDDNTDSRPKYLRAPLSGPIRPLSPDTLSNFSLDEYEQIHPPSRSRTSHNPPKRYTNARIERWRYALAAFWLRNKGLAYMLLAQVFGTMMNVTTRLLEIEGNHGKGLHPVQILFARMGITVVLASTYMWYTKTPNFPFGAPEVRWLLAARGFGGFFGVFGMYYSLLYLPLADATVITFLAPGLACWACSILINEPFTRAERFGTLISLVGVILIARPTSFFAHSGDAPPATGLPDAATGGNGTAPASDASNYDNVTPVERLGAVGIALVGVLGAVTAYTTIRWIGKRAHPLISVNYFAAWSTFVALVLQTAIPSIGFLLPSEPKEWAYLFFLGTCGFVMQFLLAAGLSYEKSSRATNMTYTHMLFALSFDKLFFGHSPNWMSIIGSSLIIGPAIYVAVQKSATSDKDATEGSRGTADEESQQGLISGVDAGHRTVETRMPVEEVQMRALR